MSDIVPSSLSILLAGVLGAASLTPAVARQLCKPVLTITQPHFSEWRLPAMKRTWTAVVSVDASRCVANSSGHFQVGFERLIENGVDIEFIEAFAWMGPSVKVGLDFWANEAVAKTWIHKVTPCTCAN